MATWGNSAQEGLNVSYSIDFDGTAKRFPASEIIDVSSLSNSGDTVSNKRKIADLSFSLYDGTGSIWEQLGHGTTAFGKSVAMEITVGGTYGNVESVNGTEFKFLGTEGGDTYTVHQGEVVGLNKKNKLITVRTENKLNKVKKVQWQAPVRTGAGNGETLTSFYGSLAFYDLSESESEDYWVGTLAPYCLYNLTENGKGGDLHAHNTPSITPTSFLGTGIYDTSGTGIQDFLGNGFTFLDTPFHQQYPSKSFKGTLLGTFIGEIDTEEQARSFGYSDLAAATADQTLGTEYEINKIRLEYATTLINTEVEVYESQLIHLVGDPTAIVRHCLFGKMVSDFLSESTDMGDTFAVSQKIVGFQSYDQFIDPEERKVEEFVNDALEMTSSIFFVSSNNQFEMAVYGPQDLTQSIDSIGTNQVFTTSYRNNINDSYNKVSLKYNWDFQDSSFAKELVGTLSDWNVLNDRTLNIDSKWVKNDNQANNFVKKILSRYEKTSPEITAEVGLSSSGVELGSLVSVEDGDTIVGTKILQIVGYEKDFGGSKKIRLRCLDGESLYRKRGYAKWEDSPLASSVTGTSKSGWSNGSLGQSNGTVNNINEDLYGTSFVYW